MVVFAEPEVASRFSSPSDLDRYRIGVVTDDVAVPLLLVHGVDSSRLVEMEDIPALLDAMDAEAIDLWCSGDLAGRYFTGMVTGDPDRYHIALVLESRDLHFAFNRDTPSSTVDAFQAALEPLRDEPDEAGVTAHQRIVNRYVGISHLPDPPVTAEEVAALVDRTAEAIAEDTPSTLARINAGEHPYWDRENRAPYVVVYDTDVTLVAEADNPASSG